MKTNHIDTKTAWLGEFPSHWQTLRIKNLFQEVDDRSETGEEELLSVSYHTGVYLKKESLNSEDDHLTNAATLIGYKKVAKGNLIINIMGAWNGRLGISDYDGVTSPAYCVYRIKGKQNPKYFGYLFRTTLFVSEFLKYSAGIGTGYLRLYSDKFFSIFSPVPPIEDQNKIVQYIKSKEEKINHFIQQKQQLIELLKEQRQSVINEAVTKGINPKAKMKASGIEWLGDIPEHWEVRRLRFLAKVNSIENNYVFATDSDSKVVFLPMEKVTELGSIDNSCKLPIKEISKGYTYFEKDDIVVAKITPCFENGKGALLNNLETYFGFGTTEFHTLRCSNLVSKEFIYLVTTSFSFRKLGISSMTGAAGQQRVPATFIKNFFVVYPSLTEQQQIVNHIKTETATIDITIAKAEKEIELIKEYKEAMIAEAVMGKINVELFI
jgi:Restriction endonuclease S subunits